MPAMILSGKEAAASLNERTRAKIDELKEKGVSPLLAIVRCGENPSDLAYERGASNRAEALGIGIRKCVFPEDVTAAELLACIDELNADASVHGVLMFRPLPSHLKMEEHMICNRLLPEKDVDCMTDLSFAGLLTGRQSGFPPCTPEACLVILDHFGIPLDGTDTVMIGRSLVVGKPLALMLTARHATVTVCHTHTKDLPGICRRAGLIVTAAGKKDSLTAACVREGQTIIDVSINYDPEKNNGEGGVTGDARFDEVAEVVSAITPVPGGVGSVTSSVLMSHVAEAARRQRL